MATTAPVVTEMELSPLQKLSRDYPADLVQKVKDIVDIEKIKEIEELGITIRQENKVAIDQAMEDLRAKMKPPTQEEVQKLLDQEFIEFKIKLPVIETDTSTATTRDFVIREVPQSVEKRIIRATKDKLLPIAQEISALTMGLLEGDAAKKIGQLLATFEPAMGVMADVCAIILDPYKKDKEMDADWVCDNLTTQRMTAIIIAQFECNRLRDFFSQLSRGISSAT